MDMPLPVWAALLEHVKMMRAPHSAPDKVVSTRNAILTAVLVTESCQERHERMANLKGLNGHSNIQDGFGKHSRNGRASDVLDVDCRGAELPAELIPLS